MQHLHNILAAYDHISWVVQYILLIVVRATFTQHIRSSCMLTVHFALTWTIFLKITFLIMHFHNIQQHRLRLASPSVHFHSIHTSLHIYVHLCLDLVFLGGFHIVNMYNQFYNCTYCILVIRHHIHCKFFIFLTHTVVVQWSQVHNTLTLTPTCSKSSTPHQLLLRNCVVMYSNSSSPQKTDHPDSCDGPGPYELTQSCISRKPIALTWTGWREWAGWPGNPWTRGRLRRLETSSAR